MTKKILEKLAVLVLPSLFWVLIAALGVGAQSLANLIELVGILLLSLIAMCIPKRFVSSKILVVSLCVVVLIIRLLMPVIPE